MAEKTETKRLPIGKGISSRRRVATAKKHARLRKKISGTSIKPRIVVNRSSRHIHVQVVDDTKGHTLASASTMEADFKNFSGDKKAKSIKVGELVAKRAKDAGIELAVFDRGGFSFSGRIAALAEGARKGGLKF